ncbi:MAG: 6-bladed beta-propeller [Caldilinea sp. CFX5]|nr:6-bladed beta-propeller [Caldilinea sp. CFX5]
MHRLFLLLLLCGSAVLILLLEFSTLSITLASASDQQQPTTATDNAVPLPGGCVNVTPPGSTTPPACCISGYVYLDGKPIAGAKIIIQETKTTSRHMSAVHTEKYEDADSPYYRLDLTATPLAINTGDLIWINVEYGDYKKTFSYKVKPGGQQVDIVLPKVTTSAYQFHHQIEAAPPDPLLLNQPNGVAMDVGGNIYVLDKENARVIVFNAQGNPLRQWGRFGSGPGQFRTPSAIAVDKWNNYVYVADYIPTGYGNTPLMPRLQKFSLSGILLGQLDNRLTPPPLPAVLNGMVVDDHGNIYLAGDTTVRKIDFAGHIAKEWGGSGSGNGQFNKASGLAFDFTQNSTTDGILYVVDSGNQRVQKFTLDGSFLGQWGSQGNGDGQFSNPQGVAVDSNKDVYVVDSGNQRLQKFNNAGSFLGRWGGLKDPTTIVGSNGSVYVADTGNHRIQQFTPDGRLLNAWGRYSVSSCAFNPWSMAVNSQGVLSVLNGYDVSSRPNRCISRFQHGDNQLEPWSIPEMYNTITTDVNDNLYGVLSIRDGLYRLRKYNNSGVIQFTVEISNHVGLVSGIAVDGNGTIYVSGTGAGAAPYQIDKLDSTGKWQTAWTNYGGVNFDRISDLAVDKANNLYVAQVYKNILKLDSTGALKGTFANDAEFAYILSISVAANNHLFVVDTGGTYRIQELNETDQLVNKWNLSVYEPNHSDIYTPTVVLVDDTNNNDQVYVIGNGGGTFWDDGILKVYRPMTFTLPIATFNHRSHIDVVPQNETLVVDGMGDVSDDTAYIDAYRWESDLNGLLGTEAILKKPANQLAAGTHLITFSVQDNKGRWSIPISFRITVTSATAPTPAPPGQANWTMLLYLDGDYNDGNQLFLRFTQVIGRLEKMSLPAKVNIAIQVDGPHTGDTRRIAITHNNQGGTTSETSYVNPEKESAMDHPDTLADFVHWGQNRFQDSRYYLAIADHGQAVRGIAWDATTDISDGVADLSAYLTVKELGEALRKTGVKPVDILHLDACSMNLLETAYELKDVASILISSQYLAWDYFSYPSYITDIGENTLPSDLAMQIVNKYAKVVSDDQHPYTISALNLRRVDDANAALSTLITEIQQSAQVTTPVLTAVRNATQTFESDGNYQNTPADLYVDLVHWLEELHKQIEAATVLTKIDELLSILKGANPLILGSRAQTNNLNGVEVKLQKANGLSIFYPNDKSNAAFTQYTDNQLFTFTKHSQWSTFLINPTTLDPGGTNTPLPAPSTMLDSDKRVFLPLIQR